MNTCQGCGAPMKTVPAGISKNTGKPYSAFEACSNRQCTFKPARTQTRPSYGQPAPTPQIGVAADMLNELKEIKAVMLAINAKLAKNLHWQQLKKVDDAGVSAADNLAEPTDELEPSEEIPF